MSLMARARLEDTSVAVSSNTERETLSWIMIDTGILNYKASQLANIAQKSFQIRGCLKYISVFNDALAKQYRGIAGLSSSNVRKFEQVLLDHGGTVIRETTWTFAHVLTVTFQNQMRLQ
jgi:hypothetical protein